MPILEKINSLPLLRPAIVPKNLQNVCIICLKDDFSKINDFIADHPQASIQMTVIADMELEMIQRLQCAGHSFKIGNLASLRDYPDFAKVFISPTNKGIIAPVVTHICRFLCRFGESELYIWGESPEYSTRKPLPDFYKDHAELLNQSTELFADEFSKITYISRIKALISGNAGYMPVASHHEYFHPLVKPEAGDIMIDGGVSDMVDAQIKLISSVGEKGHIFGFEPIPHLASIAARQLKTFSNYHLEAAGLADKPGRAIFKDMRDSSYLVADNTSAADKTINCQLESIDSFCNKNHLNRINCIKLDVEGSELAALRGARETISGLHPKLIICLYHKPEDMFEIPFFIKKLAPGYKLYISHCSCQFIDTILYASHPD